MSNPLQQAGSQSDKQPRFAPIFINTFFTGLWTQRSPLHDPSTRAESYYGGRQEALIDGVNVELTNSLTLARRPGNSAYSIQSVSEGINSFYSFKTFTTLTETIQVMMDGLTKIYTITPAAVTSIFTKATGAGAASFLGINNTLYIADGVEERAWSGSGSTRKWGIATGGLTLTSAYAGTGATASGVLPDTTQGPLGTTAGANSGTSGPTGSENWQDPTNIEALDGQLSTATLTSTAFGGVIVQDGTDYITATDFGFNIPSGSVVNGMVATFYKEYYPVGTGTGTTDYTAYTYTIPIFDATVYAVTGGTIQTGGTNQANLINAWRPGFVAPEDYGSATDTWGVTLNPSIVNASNFGVALSAKTYNGYGYFDPYTDTSQAVAAIDYVTITLYYTPPNLPEWTNPTNVVGPPNAVYATTIPSNDLQTAALLATNYFSPATITATALTSNVATYTAANVFVVGDLVTVTGTTSTAGLFNVSNQVITAASSSAFSIALVHANVGSAGDTGTATVISGTVSGVVVNITGHVSAVAGDTTLYAQLRDNNGNPIGIQKSIPITSTGDVTISFGSSTDLWGTPINLTVVNSSAFGVQIVVSGNGQTFSIDSAQIKIYTSAVTATVSGSAGTFSAVTGYQYGYAYANTAVTPAVFSNMTPASATTGAFTNKLNVGVGVVASTDSQVNTIWVFRTKDGGSTFYSLPSNPYPNTTTTITDNATDATLNIFQLPAQSGQNTPPPSGIAGMVFHMGRLWGFVNNVLYYATGPDLGNILGNPYESWGPANAFTLPSAITKLISTTVGLLVFTISDIYIVYGTGSPTAAASGVSGITVFYPAPFVPGIGLLSQFAADVNGTTIYMHTADKQLLSLEPTTGISEIGFPIGYPNVAYPTQESLQSFNPATSHVTWHVSGSADKALYVADGSTGWFRCNTSQAPEGGFVWSPKANIVGGCDAVQSIETSPGVHQLLIGPGDGGGAILHRNLSTYADNGSVYPASLVMGSIVLAYPGELAELAFITCDFYRQGTSPSVEVLLNEISGTFTDISGYVHGDPPSLYGASGGPATLYSNRYDFAQTVNGQAPPPTYCRHMQLTVDFGTDGVKNEMFSCTIYGRSWGEQ